MNKVFRMKYLLNSYVRGYIQEIQQKLTFPLQTNYSPRVKFIIFTGGRTGSTLLEALINAHPAVHCDGEIYKGRMLRPQAFLLSRSRSRQVHAYGFKLLSYQLRDIQTHIQEKRAFLARLQAENYKIIYLERENKAYQALSVICAMQKDNWHQTKRQEIKKFQLSTKRFSEVLLNIESLYEFEQKVLQPLSYFRVSYEQHLANDGKRNQLIQSIYQYLDLPTYQPTIALKKILPLGISHIIENAEEVGNYLTLQNKYEFQW